MKYIPQFLYILSFSFIGEVLQAVVPLPIPAAIYGLVLLLLALASGLLKTSQVEDAANWLISIMPILYVPICVKILEYWGVISQNVAAITIITAASTFLVFAVSGLVTQWLQNDRIPAKHFPVSPDADIRYLSAGCLVSEKDPLSPLQPPADCNGFVGCRSAIDEIRPCRLSKQLCLDHLAADPGHRQPGSSSLHPVKSL